MNQSNSCKFQLMECLWWLCAIPIYGISAYPSIYLLKAFFKFSPILFCLAVPLVFFLFLLFLLVVLGSIVTFIPKIQEGHYSLERKGEVVKWMLFSGLNNYVRLMGIQRLIYSNPLLRRLYFLAFRAKVHTSAIISYDVVLVDPFLLEIGKDAKIGDLAKISGHYSDTNKFVFKKVIIEEGAIVGGNSSVGSGAVLKKASMLCAESVLAPNTVIPKGEIWFGRPAKKIIKK